MDFKALYQDSLQLTSAIDERGIPALQRGIDQLEEASRQLKQQANQSLKASSLAGQTTSASDLNKAHFLLAGRGFDAEKLSRELSSIELKASYEPLEPLGETDVDGYLQHHHDMIVVTAIEEAKAHTARKCQRQATSFLHDEWQISKRKYLEDLGLKVGKYESSAATSMSLADDSSFTSSHSLTSSWRSRKRQQMDEQQQHSLFPSMSKSQGLDALPGSSSLSSSLSSSRVPPSSKRGPSHALVNAMDMSEAMKQNATVIRALNKSRQENMRTSFDLVTEFVKMSEQHLSPTMVDSRQQSTFRCWQLLRSILHGGSTKSKPLLEQHYAEEYQKRSSNLSCMFAEGSRQFLESLFKTYLMRTVDAWGGAAATVVADETRAAQQHAGLLGYVRSFVTAKYNLQQNLPAMFSESPLIDGVPLWIQVYYCVRCGGIAEAISLLDRVRGSPDAPVASDAFDAIYAALQHRLRKVSSTTPSPSSFSASASASAPASASSFVEKGNSMPSFASQQPQMAQYLASTYHRLAATTTTATTVATSQNADLQAKMNEVVGGVIVDPFERILTNVFGLVNPNASEPEAILTIEDFLWHKLCFCQPLPFRSATDAGQVGSRSGGVGKSYSVAQLSKTLLHYGWRHFDPHSKNPFVYFQVLLVAQEFERGIEYLCSKGCITEAMHFACALHHYGVLFTTTEAIPSSLAFSASSTFTAFKAAADNEHAISSGLVSMRHYPNGGRGGKEGLVESATERACFNYTLLVNQYTHLFASSNVQDGIEYTMLLRYRPERCASLVQLLLDTRQFGLLVGSVGVDGMRQPGLLDEYMSTDECHEIILQAASQCHALGDLTDAMELCLLVNEIEQVVQLFNTQLSDSLSVTSPYHALWKERAFQFTETFLREAWVQHRLHKSVVLGQTFQLLLNFYLFLDLVEKKQWREAMGFMDALEFLPADDRDTMEITKTVESFLLLDELIRKNFHVVLVAYMTCIVQECQELKTRNGSVNNLAQLRSRAKALTSFAGMIRYRLPNGVSERLNRMEVMMM